MEEILASIRRIISEDDAPAGAAEAEEPGALEAPEPEEPVAEPIAAAVPEPDPAPEPVEEDVLELTERVSTHGDIDAYVPEPTPEPQFEPAPEPEPVAAAPAPAPAPAPIEALVGANAAAAAASAFGQLSAAVAMPTDGLTLDAVVRELLRPLLKDWLDANLPQIVQAAVAEEVERIARGRAR